MPAAFCATCAGVASSAHSRANSATPNNERPGGASSAAWRPDRRDRPANGPGDAPASNSPKSDSRARTSAGSNTEGSTRSADGPSGASDGSSSTHRSTSSRAAARVAARPAAAQKSPPDTEDVVGAADTSPDTGRLSTAERLLAGWGSFPIDHSFRTAQTFGLAAVWRDITLTSFGSSSKTSHKIRQGRSQLHSIRASYPGRLTDTRNGSVRCIHGFNHSVY